MKPIATLWSFLLEKHEHPYNQRVESLYLQGFGSCSGGPDHEYDKEYLARGYILSVFKPSVVFLECRQKSETEIAAQIANVLQRHKVAKDGSR